MANIWREPIFDRTYSDVTFALQQIALWKQSHSHSADVRLEEDRVILNPDGTSYVAEEAFVIKSTGVVYVENEVLVMELGAVYNLKGCLNLSDLTRIEDNITYLSQRLMQYQYPISTNSKEWVKESLPTAEDMERIANNIRSLITLFAPHSEYYSATPDVILSYEDINALEYNLYLLKQYFDAMVDSFFKSGTHRCGSTNRLPIRR